MTGGMPPWFPRSLDAAALTALCSSGTFRTAMGTWATKTISGWGRYPTATALCTRPERRSEALRALAEGEGGPLLAHGEGRSYGDAALIANGRVVLTRRLDRMLAFDPETGWLRCEAGVTIEDLLRVFVPRGFFPPVVPGTQFVTLGGAVACDIHGKNHHADGSFADHVRRLELLCASGEVVVCDATHNPELFWATVGGCGLTGILLSMEVRLYPVASPYIEMESIRVESLDEFFAVSAESGDFTHTVSWVDCVTAGKALGRGIFMRGRHAAPGVGPGADLLSPVVDHLRPLLDVKHLESNHWLNAATIRLFNEGYFRKHPRGKREAVTHYEPFFFPLDFVRSWNVLYGARGFLQYQMVVPPDPDHRAVRAVLEAITGSGMASFLAVIKEFGDRQHPWLSFPRPGVTLALDFPNYGPPLLALLDRLDRIVMEAGGRIYLGKDARLGRDTFRQMFPDWEDWRAVRDRWDPAGVFRSDLGLRLGLVGS